MNAIKICLSLFFILTMISCRKYSGVISVAMFKEQDQPLADAILRNDISEIKQLIEKGANVNAVVGSSELTILDWATDFRNKEVLELLLKAGADVNKQSFSGVSAFSGLLGSNCLYTPMAKTPQETDIEILELFVKYGANINSYYQEKAISDDTHKTPLTTAVQCSIEKVKFLVEKGADINQMTFNGVPLDFLFPLNDGDISYNIAIASYLIIEKKADYNLIKPIRTGKIAAIDFFNDCGYENLRIEAGCIVIRDYVISQERKLN